MLALVVTVDPSDAEVASDALWAVGVGAIEERRIDGRTELWTAVGDDPDAATAAVVAPLAQWAWRFVEVDDSIADNWRQHAQPTWIDTDLVVCPAWREIAVDQSVRVLHIEPGSTFGLGDHPTTILSLLALRSAMARGATVLDVGCGSGVLAIGACVLGASRALAIDISPAAVPVTEANASANGVADRVDASNTPLSEVGGQFDLVVANILAPTLIELAADLRRVVAPSGALIVSGVLAGNHTHVESALRPMRRVARATRDGWAALTLRYT